VPPTLRDGRSNNSTGVIPVVIAVEKLRAGLISGGSTPICSATNNPREAQFKDFWSDDTKNNYREER
jgi:hypothetical protein